MIGVLGASCYVPPSESWVSSLRLDATSSLSRRLVLPMRPALCTGLSLYIVDDMPIVFSLRACVELRGVGGGAG